MAAPAAHAATVSARMADDALVVRFRAEPGEPNEVRVLRHETGVRFAAGAELATGAPCFAVRPGDVRCGPPGAGGLEVFTRTGDGDDNVFSRIGSVWLGRGDDSGFGSGEIDGGPGNDDLRAILGQGIFSAGPGRTRCSAALRRTCSTAGRGRTCS